MTAKRKNDLFTRLAEITIGLLLLISGIGKADNAEGFGELISSYGLEWFSILSPVIIVGEIGLGLCILLRILPRLMSVCCMLMLLLFTGAYTYAYHYHGIVDCGCFGSLATSMPVWAFYLRNTLLLLLAVYVFRAHQNFRTKWSWPTVCLLVTVMAAAVFWTGHTWKPSSFYTNRFASPHPLIGIEVNDSPLSAYLHAASDSTYLVWVFSYSCSSCLNSIENIKQYQKGVADRFMPLAVTSDSKGRIGRLLAIPFKAPNVGEALSGFIEVLPTLLYIKGGHIEYVIEGSVPSVYFFKKVYLEMSDDEILRQQTIVSTQKN